MKAPNGWREISPPPGFGPLRAFAKGGNRVLVGQEPVGPGGAPRWHLSISRQDRYPGWHEIRDARYSLVPLDVTVAMLLPPLDRYVNEHPNCFHLWQVEDSPWLKPQPLFLGSVG